MKKIEKLNPAYSYTTEELVNKINELLNITENLDFEVKGIHEWKIEKEGI
jgi:hypothetical protein